MTSIEYIEPSTLDELVRILLAEGDEAHVIAGGTSLILMLRQQLLEPRLLVGLRRLDQLRGIRQTESGGLEIGAMTTHRAIERSTEVHRYEPALADAFSKIATVRIRNQGTIGGNLAHADPAQDPPAILIALDAIVRIVGPAGTRELPVSELFVDYLETSLLPGEIIESVCFPGRDAQARASYTKFLPRTKDDYATVAIAVSARRSAQGWANVRIAAGAAGPTPLRLRKAEMLLEGSQLEDRQIEEAASLAAEEVDPIADGRGSSDYKREMARVWTRRALAALSRPLSSDGSAA